MSTFRTTLSMIGTVTLSLSHGAAPGAVGVTFCCCDITGAHRPAVRVARAPHADAPTKGCFRVGELRTGGSKRVAWHMQRVGDMFLAHVRQSASCRSRFCRFYRRQEKIEFWDDVYGFDMSRIKAMALLEPLVDNVDPEQVAPHLALWLLVQRCGSLDTVGWHTACLLTVFGGCRRG